MSGSIRMIGVLVASPGGLEPERDAIGSAIDELNLGVARHVGTRFEMLGWKTHVAPELGSDPQAVINRQIDGKYQVFVGVLWDRFGTATPRAESGTAEEFELAKTRWEEDPDSVSVKFYFKNEPIPPAEIDPDQLSKVQKFRKDLGKGALYAEFQTPANLAQLVRLHLTSYLFVDDSPDSNEETTPDPDPDPDPASVTSIGRSASRALSSRHEGPQSGLSMAEHSEDSEEPGLLDLVEDAQAELQGVVSVVSGMTDGMTQLTQLMRDAATGVNNAKLESGEVDYKRAKTVINELASSLDPVASSFEVSTDEFRARFGRAIDTFVKSTEVSLDFGDEALEVARGNRESVALLGTKAQESRAMTDQLRSSIDSLPRVTTRFNRTRRRLSKVLGEMGRQFSVAESLVSEAVIRADQIISSSS